jgi:hypothetical protein
MKQQEEVSIGKVLPVQYLFVQIGAPTKHLLVVSQTDTEQWLIKTNSVVEQRHSILYRSLGTLLH